ncbi:cytochrome P450 [Sporodiniella umbellata]|nr:cytochrome P450 [Sporodiniella umbellata]
MSSEILNLAQDAFNKLVEKLDKHKLPDQINSTKAVALGLSTLAAYHLLKNTIYRLYFHPLNKIPGPRVSWIPLMGNFFELMSNEIDKSPLIKWAEKYGGIFKFHNQWNQPHLVVTDPQILKQILTTHAYDYEKPERIAQFLLPVVGNGVLLAEGEAHRYQRKMLNPAFSVSSIRDMVPLMLGPGRTLRDQWLEEISKSDKEFTEIKVSRGLSLATLDIIGITAFGQDFQSIKNFGTDKVHPFTKSYEALFQGELPWNEVVAFFIPLFRFFPTRRQFVDRKNINILHRESEKLVDAGIKRKQKEESFDKDKRSKDLLSLMVNLIDEETGKGFTRAELRDQCLTFLAAGHDTTSDTLCWALWLLAGHQDVQHRLREEIQPLFEGDRLSSYDAVSSLSYLDHVCRETLRRIPTVARSSRVNIKPVTLGPYYVPKGTTIHIPQVVTQLSKDIWGEDAMEFKPERWEKSDKLGNAYEYYPFLVGGHQCIGHRFATIEFKVLLCLLIKDMQFFEKPLYQIKKKQIVTTRAIPDMTLWVKRVSS